MSGTGANCWQHCTRPGLSALGEADALGRSAALRCTALLRSEETRLLPRLESLAHAGLTERAGEQPGPPAMTAGPGAAHATWDHTTDRWNDNKGDAPGWRRVIFVFTCESTGVWSGSRHKRQRPTEEGDRRALPRKILPTSAQHRHRPQHKRRATYARAGLDGNAAGLCSSGHPFSSRSPPTDDQAGPPSPSGCDGPVCAKTVAARLSTESPGTANADWPTLAALDQQPLDQWNCSPTCDAQLTARLDLAGGRADYETT